MTDGALLLDKPVGISSNRALQDAKRIYGVRKAGHAGTLDPLASARYRTYSVRVTSTIS